MRLSLRNAKTSELDREVAVGERKESRPPASGGEKIQSSEEHANGGLRLAPRLGLIDATAINIGAIIGAGVFVVTGIATGFAGSALLVSILLGSVVSIFTALSFIELTEWLPTEGGVYEFAYQLVSPMAGFLTGWMWVISNLFARAAVSLGFAYYLAAFLPGLPTKAVAVALTVCFTALNYYGARQTSLTNNIIVFSKVVILAIFVLFGLSFVDLGHFEPFEPLNTGVLLGAYYIFFAFGGFARVTVISEEIKDPRKTIPRAILLSLAITTVIYLLVAFVAVGVAGVPVLSGSSSPLKDAMAVTGNNLAIYLISIGGLLATSSVLLTSIMGVSRVVFAMGRRRDLPRVLSRVDPRRNTPPYSIVLTGVLICAFVLLVDLEGVIAVSTFSQIFYYTVANASAARLKPEARAYPVVISLIGIVSCLGLMVAVLFLSIQAVYLGLAGIALGFALYLLKKRLVQWRHRPA